MDEWLEAFVAVKLLQSSEICFQCKVCTMSFLVALWIDLRGEGVGKAASAVPG